MASRGIVLGIFERNRPVAGSTRNVAVTTPGAYTPNGASHTRCSKAFPAAPTNRGSATAAHTVSLLGRVASQAQASAKPQTTTRPSQTAGRCIPGALSKCSVNHGAMFYSSHSWTTSAKAPSHTVLRSVNSVDIGLIGPPSVYGVAAGPRGRRESDADRRVPDCGVARVRHVLVAPVALVVVAAARVQAGVDPSGTEGVQSTGPHQPAGEADEGHHPRDDPPAPGLALETLHARTGYLGHAVRSGESTASSGLVVSSRFPRPTTSSTR